jgi:hypothetical protein
MEVCCCKQWEAGSRDRGQFGNSEEDEGPPLETAIKQQLEKTEKILCVPQLRLEVPNKSNYHSKPRL